MRLYIAGPMRGYPLWNFPAFDAAAEFLARLGIGAVYPADMDRAIGVDETQADDAGSFGLADFHAAMRRDIPAVLACDGILLLEGWEGSTGANIERTVNQAVGGREFRALYAEDGRLFDIYEWRGDPDRG